MTTHTDEIVPDKVYLTKFEDAFRVASTVGPLFCFARERKEEALALVVDALREYLAWKSPTTASPTIGRTEAFRGPVVPFRAFDPQEVVYIDANAA